LVTSLLDPLVEAALNLGFGILFAAGALAANSRYGLNISREPLGPAAFLASVAVGAALFGITLLIPAPPQDNAPSSLESHTAATVLTYISILIVAPIWEELISEACCSSSCDAALEPSSPPERARWASLWSTSATQARNGSLWPLEVLA
jgi:hypothetical protein